MEFNILLAILDNQYIGLKCRNCSLACHKECLRLQPIRNDCAGLLITGNDLNPSWNINEAVLASQHQFIQQTTVQYPPSIPPLDTSAYSMQTASSCSTTPNSHFSHNILVNTFNTPKYVQYLNNHTNSSSFMPTHSTKLDTDIGSACGNFNFAF